MSEETKSEEVKETADPNSQSGVVEVEWEEAQELYSLRGALVDAENRLARMLLQHEKQKFAILERVTQIESAMYDSAGSLKDKKGIDPEFTYEFKLPQAEGEKGYFIRKDS